MKSAKARLKYMMLLLKGTISIKVKFKLVGTMMMLSAFGVITTNNTFHILGYDTSLYIKLSMLVTFLVGLFYLLFTDTDNFKLGSIGLKVTDNINSEKTLPTPSNINSIIIKEGKDKYVKREISELKFNPIYSINTLLNRKNILVESSYDDLKSLIEEKVIKEKISLTSQNDKNIFVYDPMFDFFDEAIEGGINAFYGKSRRDFLNFIVRNFSKKEKPFKYDNLRKRYTEWLNKRNTYSDIYFSVNQTYILSELL